MRKIWRGRNACDILEEMRKMDKTKNYSAMIGCVEELQIVCQRMEDALSTQKDFRELDEKRIEANKIIKKYRKEMNKHSPNFDKLEELLEELRCV